MKKDLTQGEEINTSYQYYLGVPAQEQAPSGFRFNLFVPLKSGTKRIFTTILHAVYSTHSGYPLYLKLNLRPLTLY